MRRTATSARSAKGAKMARGTKRPLDMRLPERGGHRVILRNGKLIGNGRSRPVRKTAVAVDAAQCVGFARKTQAHPPPESRHSRGAKKGHPEGAADRRQPEPKAEP